MADSSASQTLTPSFVPSSNLNGLHRPLREHPAAVADDSPSKESEPLAATAQIDGLVDRLNSEPVNIRVYEVLVRGNTKTKTSLIEALLEEVKKATTTAELLEASRKANAKLREREIFDSVQITLDAGPPELPGTADVIVDVTEAKYNGAVTVDWYTKPRARSWILECALKCKNVFGYGDMWKNSYAWGPYQSEISTGVVFPRIKGFVTPVEARVFLDKQDWQDLSSYKEKMGGLSHSLVSSRHHDLVYTCGVRTLTDRSQMASESIRKQLGDDLISSLKYTFTLDRRDSSVLPTQGYSIVSSSHVGGLAPGTQSAKFLRQELDFRFAFPLICATLNMGVSGGVIFPWGNGFLNKPTSLPERFFLGGDFSPLAAIRGCSTFLGFQRREISPADLRRHVRDNSNDENAATRDFVGGDLAVSGFSHMSFPLPFCCLRECGVHGHAFVSSGNVTKLAENEFRNFSFQRFVKSFQTSVGLGIVIPANIFRIQCNFSYILKQFERDRDRPGIQICIGTWD